MTHASHADLGGTRGHGPVVPEPEGGAHHDHAAAAEMLRKSITTALDELAKIPNSKLLEARYDKFRKVGVFADA